MSQKRRMYAAAAVPIFTWSALSLFNKLPSWLLSLDRVLIWRAFAYNQVGVLGETLVAGGFLIGLGYLLPRRWFVAGYAGFACALGLAGGAVMSAVHLTAAPAFRARVEGPVLPWLWGLLVAAALALATWAARNERTARAAEALADRLALLLWVYVPVSGVAVVILVVHLIAGA